MTQRIFGPGGEKAVTAAIVSEFSKEFMSIISSDCIIVGGGPAGLVAGRILAAEGYNTVIIERNNFLGGGFWIGGYFMNKVTFRSPSDVPMRELGVRLTETVDGIFVADGPHACSKVIAAACDAGVKILNMTSVDDVVLREDNRVAGVVINWSAVSSLPRQISCLDPVAIESKIVIDSTGHDASVIMNLEKRGILKTEGCGAMWIERSEDLLVEKTGLVHPGLIAAGMAVSTMYGIPRMGPTFGSMILSGQKAAECAIAELKKQSAATAQPSIGKCCCSEDCAPA